jgi:hypothetical protein
MTKATQTGKFDTASAIREFYGLVVYSLDGRSSLTSANQQMDILATNLCTKMRRKNWTVSELRNF